MPHDTIVMAATIDESRYIEACRRDPGTTMFWIRNGMCLHRIKLTDEALNAMVGLRDRLVQVETTCSTCADGPTCPRALDDVPCMYHRDKVPTT